MSAVIINIDASVAAMQSRLYENRDGIGGANTGDLVCMHKVPGRLTGISSKAIRPEMVSIGPYHRSHNRDELLIFEKYKWWSLDRLLNSISQRRAGPDLRVLFEAAYQLKERARRCYDESTANMSDQEFVELMVLDGCFIIELFRHGGSNEDVIANNDPLLGKTGFISILTGDLLKLENQLPFFVLERLFSLSSDPDNDEHPLQFLALKFFNVSLPKPNEEALTMSSEFRDVKHLLHLFHFSFSTDLQRRRVREPTSFQVFVREARLGPGHLIRYFADRSSRPSQVLARQGSLSTRHQPRHVLSEFFSGFFRYVGVGLFPITHTDLMMATTTNFAKLVILLLKNALYPGNQDLDYRPSSESIQCMSTLRSAGVDVKVHNTGNFLDIIYTRTMSRLQIPHITIDDLTISIFINSIALEQCNHQDVVSYFTTYIAFMSCLVTSSKDVGLLSGYGIITSTFSHNDHDVAALFKMLAEKVNFHKKECYLSRQFRDMEVYYNSPWANLKRTYFGRPWSVISFFSAFAILVFTAGQTVLAILSFIQKKQ